MRLLFYFAVLTEFPFASVILSPVSVSSYVPAVRPLITTSSPLEVHEIVPFLLSFLASAPPVIVTASTFLMPLIVSSAPVISVSPVMPTLEIVSSVVFSASQTVILPSSRT